MSFSGTGIKTGIIFNAVFVKQTHELILILQEKKFYQNARANGWQVNR